MDSLKCVEYVDEKRTISAYYHEKLRSGTRVGVIPRTPETRMNTGFLPVKMARDTGLILFSQIRHSERMIPK